jgi:hypothetical protein
MGEAGGDTPHRVQPVETAPGDLPKVQESGFYGRRRELWNISDGLSAGRGGSS